jgi:O-antigen/teichoic acid export membrane protein
MSKKNLKKRENGPFLARLFLDALNKAGAASKSEGMKSFLLHVAPRIFRLVTGIIGGAVVTRYLGPENFGVFAFANMVAAWACCLVQIGSLEVITKNTAVNPAQIPKQVQIGLLFRFLGSLPAMGIILISSIWFGHMSLYSILALLPLALVPDAIEAVFFGRSQFDQTALIRMVVSAMGLAARLVLVFYGARMEGFAWITVGEGLIIGSLMLWKGRTMFRAQQNEEPCSWRSFLTQSLPLVAVAVVVGLALRLDQFILQACRPGPEVGYYLVVVRLFEMGNIFIPSLLAVLLPDLARWRHLAMDEYQQKMVRLYTLIYRWGFLASCFLALLAPLVIPILFGDSFRASIPIFMAYAFTFPSFLIGNIRAMDFLLRGQNEHHLIVILCLVPIQIPLCWWMAMWAGPFGMALAMVATTFISTTLFSLVLPPLRESGQLQLLALKGVFRGLPLRN